MDDTILLVKAGGEPGPFLLGMLGMLIMTEGLRTLAGAAIRHFLMKFTRTPLSVAATWQGLDMPAGRAHGAITQPHITPFYLEKDT